MTLPRVTYSNITEDFSGVHAHLDALIPKVEAELLGKRHSAWIAGQDRSDGDVVALVSPIDRDIILGEFPISSPALVDEAVSAAKAAYAGWRDMGWAKRVAILREAAKALERRKYEVSVACLIEVGKSRMEAIGEVEEAIDLINYYCAEMESNDGFAAARPAAVPSETSRVVLRPFGVFAVIAPFNFPVALSLGMATAALVAGNTVVIKPGEASSLTGRLIVEALIESGIPSGVVNLIYGGRETGAALTTNPAVDGFAFTGSNVVGMEILRHASSGKINRPVLAEMGGKNPTFVTASADLDIAASGMARSAFGMQGQKCSAGSKAYVARSIYDEFMDRLLSATAALKVGDPRLADTFVGPVINQASLDRFNHAAQDAARDGKILTGGEQLRSPMFDKGAYVQPTIVSGLGANHRLNREELFLPFLSIQPYDILGAAINDANLDEYGLTAGIYAQDQAELEMFLNTIEAGVLYANRASGATTGAWPGIQTFCGWKGSGTSGKGGLGTWYVPQFMREQSHTLFAV